MPDKQYSSHESRDAAIRAAVTELVPLYSDGETERPSSCCRSYPNSPRIVEALRILIDVMQPGRLQADADPDEAIDLLLTRQLAQAWDLLLPEIEKAISFRWRGQAARSEGKVADVEPAAEARRVLAEFFQAFPAVRKFLVEDVQAAYDGDPAALTYAEVQLAYPGLLAIVSHRLAHELYRLNIPVVPRIMSEWTHTQTGVDIHPGAVIGHGFFIDHATGVVIGETSVIGNRVKLYQGVTIGAKSFPLDEFGRPIKHIKRHPTIEDDVVVYANATILGGDTVIGTGSTIGASVFLMESVPPGSVVRTNHPELQIK